MELEYRILYLYKTKQYSACLNLCNELPETGCSRPVEFARLRALTIQAKIAGNGYEEVEYFPQQDELTTTTIAKTPRPGTSFQHVNSMRASSTDTDRPRPGTTRTAMTTRSRTARTVLRTASRMSRAATALVAKTAGSTVEENSALFEPTAPLSLRLVSKDDKLFIPAAKTLYEYVYYCEGDVRKAMEIVYQAQKADESSDWWWHFSLGRCYQSLSMFRSAEESLRQALKLNKHISIYMRLVAMYVGLGQPLSALEMCKQGLSAYHDYTPLVVEQARIYEEMGNPALAVKEYRMVAVKDPTNTEAVANIAVHNFYNDQPEIALRYYRRLMATNPPSPEIYNNLGLCCLYCNQWDLIIPCFRQALYFSSSPDTKSDIWFNLSHVALSTGDLTLFRRCLQVCLAINSEHQAARAALLSLDARLQSGQKNISVRNTAKCK